jgi:SAM-dependent methyltransferase
MKFIDEVKLILTREQFQPRFVALFTNPFYFARKGLYQHVESLSHFIEGKTLDVGCGQKPYKDLFHSSDYVGLELDLPENRASKQADYFYDGNVFPFADQSFDSVVANQVLEHVFNPAQFLTEIRRVIKDEGIILLTVPFVWDEHEQPFDYARYSSFGLKHLLNAHGFEILEFRKSMDDIRLIFQLINGFIYKKALAENKFAMNNKFVNLTLVALLVAPFNILGELAAFIFPRNQDLYLDNIVVARKGSVL